MEISLRQATPNDLRYVTKTFKMQLYKAMRPSPDWGTFHSDFGDLLVQLANEADFVVGCFDSVPDEVVGFSITQGETLWWVAVKAHYIGNGVARQLTQGVTRTPWLIKNKSSLYQALVKRPLLAFLSRPCE